MNYLHRVKQGSCMLLMKDYSSDNIRHFIVLILQNIVLVKGQQKAPFSKCINGVLWYMQHLFWDVLQHDNSKWAYFMSIYEN